MQTFRKRRAGLSVTAGLSCLLLVKNVYWLLRNCIFFGGTFILSHPVVYLECEFQTYEDIYYCAGEKFWSFRAQLFTLQWSSALCVVTNSCWQVRLVWLAVELLESSRQIFSIQYITSRNLTRLIDTSKSLFIDYFVFFSAQGTQFPRAVNIEIWFLCQAKWIICMQDIILCSVWCLQLMCVRSLIDMFCNDIYCLLFADSIQTVCSDNCIIN